MKNTDYTLLSSQLKALIDGEKHIVSCLCNASAALWQAMDNINWAGFYLVHEKENGEKELLLSAFQGKPACMHIAFGKGVCGTAAQKGETITVNDVHSFPNHIACDCASNSEIVVPIFSDGDVVGVLDIDSPEFSRFGADDRIGLENFVKIIESIDGWHSFKY